MNDALGREVCMHVLTHTQHTKSPPFCQDAAGLKLEDVVFGMKSFVDKVSSHAGAEFPWYVFCIFEPFIMCCTCTTHADHA